MPKIVELRQDRSLMRSNFDGYKLSLDTVPLLRRDLTSPPLKAEANEEQYSLHHAELFSMQNLLFSDPWSRATTFYVNTECEIVRSGYDENTGRPEVLQVVFRSKDCPGFGEGRKEGDYNYSMRIISEKYCVLCDGIKQLLLLETGDRLKTNEWKVIAQTNIEIKDAETERNYLIFDCRLDTIQEQKEISLILGRVERRQPLEKDGLPTHYMNLHWAQWILKETWTFSVLDTLEGKGSIYYCAFQPRADALILSSNREFEFRSKVEDAPIDMTVAEKPQLHDEDSVKETYSYTWSQSDDDVVIKFDVREGKDKTDYSVRCLGDKLTVMCSEEVLFDSTLSEKLDQDLTTWTIENNFLQVTLIKQNVGQPWASLLKNSAGPKETTDSGRQCDLPQEQQPIANLEVPVEDCDFPIGTIEDEIKISRFHLPTKSITHTVLLGSSPPLFATNLRPGFPLALATRQDVDACLWLQQYNTSKPEEWSLRHEGNLHALGYVQASKQQKKFMDCSPDLNYSIICESYRHIFLYKTNYDGANGLRNRNGPQVSLGKQHLITLENTEEILGLATAPNVVTLLTENSILYLQIN